MRIGLWVKLELVALRFQVSCQDHDPDFMMFVAIESLADHVPSTEARALCTPAWLAKCDKDAHQLEKLYRKGVEVACAQLVRRFS